jgi:hypothetical protein
MLVTTRPASWVFSVCSIASLAYCCSNGVGEQLQGGDVGVAVDDAPHQFGARIGGDHRAFLDPWHEVVQRADVGGDPGQQRDHQAPVGFGEQHQRTDGVDQHVPQRIHRLHGESRSELPVCMMRWAMRPAKSFWKKFRLCLST